MGKYVHKKDLLGWSQNNRDYAIPHALWSKWKSGGRGRSYALAVHDEDCEMDETYEHESIYGAVYEAQSLSPQKKKKPATTFFVLHDKIESDGEHDNEQTDKASLARAPSTSYEQYLADGVVKSQDNEIKFHSSVDTEPNSNNVKHWMPENVNNNLVMRLLALLHHQLRPHGVSFMDDLYNIHSV
ncbi:unnamed protein product [Cladocopium goreaui]|uniref:Uncharacterized protein n=1 Tax=Cladocopium goreaui TaxID=2562237 RepID=A0A9P1CNT1_9DINO|nr:unnamed protein product [Cladocopium goreaui]